MKPSLQELIDYDAQEGNRNRVIEPNNRVIEPAPTLDVPINRLIYPSIKYHQAHRLAFTFEYSGKQPTKGVCSKFGRYCNSNPAYRYKLEYPEYNAIAFAYKRSLLIWIKKPKGTKTVEQLIEARRLARECAQAIAFKYQLAITREREAGFSEHIIVSKSLDKVIRPLAKEEPELLKERCGISLNIRSHKGKLEHHDRDKRPEQPRAKDRVMILENVLEGDIATKQDITTIVNLIKEQTNSMSALIASNMELNKNIHELVLGSVRPPDKPQGGAYR